MTRGRRPGADIPRAALAVVVLAVTIAIGGWGLARALEPVFAPARLEFGTVVWAVGDGGDGSAGARRLARVIDEGRIDHFLYLGDVYENGGPEDFSERYAPVFGALAPLTSPTPGNHEWGARARGYYPYWERAHGRPQPPYYAFAIDGWEVLSLNSEAPHGEGSPQLSWLRERLRRGHGGTCRIAFWHRPRFSAGAVHGDQADVEPLWAALRGRTALVLNGHEHNSQRFKPRDGVVELVAGAGRGDRPLHPLREDSRLAFGNGNELAALRLELRPRRARFAFISAGGRALDSGTVPCSR